MMRKRPVAQLQAGRRFAAIRRVTFDARAAGGIAEAIVPADNRRIHTSKGDEVTTAWARRTFLEGLGIDVQLDLPQPWPPATSRERPPTQPALPVEPMSAGLGGPIGADLAPIEPGNEPQP
jgi:hypothetical protein